eukprot:2998399-Pyramimonas_sp.AAC.1
MQLELDKQMRRDVRTSLHRDILDSLGEALRGNEKIDQLHPARGGAGAVPWRRKFAPISVQGNRCPGFFQGSYGNLSPPTFQTHGCPGGCRQPVSYTHLTLPTILLV